MGKSVIDDGGTNTKKINSTLASLMANPDDQTLRQTAVGLGILPPDSVGGPLGIGGWARQQALELVSQWQKYFPSHIVPHPYPETGNVGVRLTITDASGITNQSFQNYAITSGCPTWGGVFQNLFEGYTVCDTAKGLAVMFGPKRPHDYVSIGINLPMPKNFNIEPTLTIVSPLHLLINGWSFLELS